MAEIALDSAERASLLRLFYWVVKGECARGQLSSEWVGESRPRHRIPPTAMETFFHERLPSASDMSKRLRALALPNGM